MSLLFSGIYRIRARIPVVGYAKNPVWNKTASCFVYIYTTNLTLCIYSTYTVQEHHLTYYLLLIVLWKGCIYFWYYGFFFLAHQYIGEATATTIKNFDGPTGLKLCRGILFFGDLRVELKGLCVQIFYFLFGRDPTDDKHNFVSFAFQIISLCLPFSPNPSNMSLFPSSSCYV